MTAAPWRPPREALPETQQRRPLSTDSEIWVLLPTYNEIDNLRPIAAEILAALPASTLLVVDDASPDGTGALADQLAAEDGRIRVLHRAGKEGLGRAYIDGFRTAIAAGADVLVQMDADGSHNPTVLPTLVRPLIAGEADLVIGSRYTPGGRVLDWGLSRRLISRGGSVFARLVLGLAVRDLTGGFKAWAAKALEVIEFDRVHAGGYAFQIEMTFRASRAGARIREIPITFRDRIVGASKMSRSIVAEALLIVARLRLEELLGLGSRTDLAERGRAAVPPSK